VRRQHVYIRSDKALALKPLPDSNACTTVLKANCFADSLGIPSRQKKQVLEVMFVYALGSFQLYKPHLSLRLLPSPSTEGSLSWSLYKLFRLKLFQIERYMNRSFEVCIIQSCDIIYSYNVHIPLLLSSALTNKATDRLSSSIIHRFGDWTGWVIPK
jgi:hypothetical protein